MEIDRSEELRDIITYFKRMTTKAQRDKKKSAELVIMILKPVKCFGAHQPFPAPEDLPVLWPLGLRPSLLPALLILSDPPFLFSFFPSFLLPSPLWNTSILPIVVALSTLNTPLFVTEPGISQQKFSKPNCWNFNSDEEISLSVWEACSPVLFSFSPLCFHSDASTICISFWGHPIEQLSVSNRMGKIQGTAPHPSELRTYHLTISTPLGLRRTVLPWLNVISASNNYLLLEKNLLRDMEPTGTFDFKAGLVIPKFQLGKEICNYLSRTRHFTGTITTFHCEKRACFIVWCATRFLIKETAFLRLNLP